MHSTTHVLWTILLVAFFGACAGSSGGASDPALATAKRSQAEGARVYEKQCAACHGTNGRGGPGAPAVIGPGSLPREHDDRAPFHTAADLFAYTKAKMPLPPSLAGSLSDEQYWSVVAYMVAANGIALPGGELNAANAASVKLAR